MLIGNVNVLWLRVCGAQQNSISFCIENCVSCLGGLRRQHRGESVSSPVDLHIHTVLVHCLMSPLVCLESMGHLRIGQRWFDHLV